MSTTLADAVSRLVGARRSGASLRNHTVLVTGGAGATGLATAQEIHRRGARVVIGTRSHDRYSAAAARLGGTRVRPFIADLTQGDAVQRQLGDLGGHDWHITDVVHSAAGGLEPIFRDLMRRLMRLARLSGSDLDAALAVFRAEVPALVDTSRDFATRANVKGPAALFEQVAKLLRPGGSLIYYTSLWGSLYGSVEVPTFYDAVAQSKHAFETWLLEKAGAWTARGLNLAVVSGHIIKDSQLGEVIDRYMVPLLPTARQDAVRSFFITTSDMVQSAVSVVDKATHNGHGAFVRVFLTGPGRAVSRLDASSPALSDRFPL